MSGHDHPPISPASPIGAVPTVDTQDHAPMTEKQAALLRHLCSKADEPFDRGLTRQQARQRIDALEARTGRL